MLDEFYYENHAGERVNFGSGGIYANYNDLRDYQWTFSTAGGRARNFRRLPVEKTLPVVFVGADSREKRDKAFEVFEKDVLADRDGKFYINDSYLECRIYASANSQYLQSHKFLRTAFAIVSADPVWKRKAVFSFAKSGGADSSGIDYPYDYPHDYTESSFSNFVLNNTFFGKSDFKMTFYGPTTDPAVEIGGHLYKMNCSIFEGERIEIDSEAKTIKRIAPDGSETNYFRFREKSESIFEKIGDGLQRIRWGGSFGFDIELTELRSEPRWNIEKEDHGGDEPVEEKELYLLDDSGELIFDSDGDRIESGVA